MEYSCIMICGNKWTDWYGIRRTYFNVARSCKLSQ
ncbi:hypothetical protein V3C99_015619 [Haemonchus contortus]|uniref:Uncharacterized protein n=1 Tax=Haemonchus contortus TaxID=6289 RepID=A0A7I4YYN7_HAECO